MTKRKRTTPNSSKRRMFKRWKRRTKKGRKKRKTLSVIPRPIKCFPNSMKFTLRYCDGPISIPNHNSGAGPYCFRMNSIHDPDKTGGGHQPRFHDQIAGIYSKYCVIGARAYIELLSSGISGDSQDAGQPTVFAYLDDAATADSRSLEQHIELGMPNSAYIMSSIPGDNTRLELSRSKRSFAMNYGLRKFWGVDKKTQVIFPAGTGNTDEYVEESNFAAKFGTNPAKECFLKLKVFDTSLTSNTAVVYARITIDYQVVAFAPIEVGAS